MSLNRAPESRKQWKYGILPEGDAYGHSDEGISNICELSCEDVNIDRGIKIRKLKGSKASKDPIAAERFHSTSGSVASFSVTMPMNPYAAASSVSPLYTFLVSHFQYASSNVLSYFDTHPTGDGVDHSFTFFAKSPVDGEDKIVEGCVVKAADFTFERGELITTAFECEGKNAGKIDQTITGTFQSSGSAGVGRPTFEDFTYQVDTNGTGDSTITCKSASVHFGWDKVESLSPDGEGGYADKGFVGRENCTFSFTILRDDQAVLADTAFEKGQSVKLTITAGAPLSAAGDITDMWFYGMVDSIEPGADTDLDEVTISCTMSADTESDNIAEIDLT